MKKKENSFDLSMVKKGDILDAAFEGDYEYFSVVRVEKRKIICVPWNDEKDYYEDGCPEYLEYKFYPKYVDYYPCVYADAEKLIQFLRYEKSFDEVFGDIRPYVRIRCDKHIILSAEDLLCVIKRFKEKGFDTAEKEWIKPVRVMSATIFVFAETSQLNKQEKQYRFLLTPDRLLYNVFLDLINCRYNGIDEPDYDDLIRQTENIIKMRTLPVIEREYPDWVMEDYIARMDNDEMYAAATDDEIALFVKFTDILCEKGNKTAMYAKAYALYGGNRAYDCDWCASRDLLLRLMEIDENPFLANTLGYIYYYGRCTDGVPEYDKAFYYYNIGAAGYVYESRYKLSDMYRHGYGVKKNDTIARKLIDDIYDENYKYILSGETKCKFADVALRMGNLWRDGIDCEKDADKAYYYYLQADFAIKQRLREVDWYGDKSVAAGITQEIEKILPVTSYKNKKKTACYFTLLELLKNAFLLHHRVEAKIKTLKGGRYRIHFRILPKGNEENPPKLFVTIPEAHFCGYLDKLTVTARNVCDFQIQGKTFDGDEATVVFDDADSIEYFLYGESVMLLDADEYVIHVPQHEKEYRFVSLVFSPGGKHYDYLCDSPDVKVGDEVTAPDYGITATVAAVFTRKESECAKPIKKYKRIKIVD